MGSYVLGFDDLDRSQVAVVGGKGANLAQLAGVAGIRVPAGFCVTTDAFRQLQQMPAIEARIARLRDLDPADLDALRATCADLRANIEATPVPDDVATAVAAALERLGADVPCAVRSSATAEDLPTASFAGQSDTHLNVIGLPTVLHQLRRCWASLYTERAVAYRARLGLDHRRAQMAVVVQRMVVPEVSGVLFTADPVSGNRRITIIEAVFGLGEALVSGAAPADGYRYLWSASLPDSRPSNPASRHLPPAPRGGHILTRAVATKVVAVRPAMEGGTRREAIAPELQQAPALTDAQVVRLAELGRRLEAHFGRPQDVEWCLADDTFYIVQSRPITTLYPIPSAVDAANRVYLSVGHQQMMTDAMRPLGLSIWQLTAARPMAEAGGRLFVDVTEALASSAGRAGVMQMAGRSDPLVADALRTLAERGDFLPAPAEGPAAAPTLAALAAAPIEADPALVAELVERSEASLATLGRDIRTKSGVELLDFILADLEALKRINFDPRSMQAIMAGVGATWWLNDKLHAWLREKNAADTLTLSAPNNVTSEMGLALLDVADVVRRHPEVVAFLEAVDRDGALEPLRSVAGGEEAWTSIQAWLDRYGMRCVGEIDITRPRWSERPAALAPLILGNVRAFEPGEAARRFTRGRAKAEAKEAELSERLRALPEGEAKVAETRAMIARVRTFMGYREYPKYGMVRRYFLYKQALLEEAGRLVREGVLRAQEDIFYLTFTELQDVVRTGHVDEALLAERRETFDYHRTLVPPRVLTSEGECLSGTWRRDDAPAGALMGLAVSAGTVEGRARVLHDVEGARLEPGDILVTTCTDPSWTPLFVAVRGLVTEVGGLMTHGAVVAREYGLPAVVGVENATRRIRDGQRIRVSGTEGYVELLDGAP